MSGYAKLNNNIDWNTPTKYVIAITEFFNIIDLDPCSNYNSIINSKYKYILPQDGLKLPWMKHTYVNPPYGKGIKQWFAKAYDEYVLNNNEILMLVPVATNTSHWKEYVWGKAKCICFLYDTRLKFRINNNENNKGCPMSCCFIYYGTNIHRFFEVFNKFGYCIKI